LCADDRDFFRPPGQRGYVVQPVEVRSQVSMSRRTGTARQGLLFSTEYGVPALRFDGRIFGSLEGALIDDAGLPNARTYPLTLLLAALLCLDRLGGNKSAGAGRVDVQVSRLLVDGTERTVEHYLDGVTQLEYYDLAEEES
jgi:CRISPR/Cas system CSM-associated protein Csm3 (group 7 of RAMP superfamily)